MLGYYAASTLDFLGLAIGGWQRAGTALVLADVCVLSRPAAARARPARKENA